MVPPVPPVSASGGAETDITVDGIDYKLHTFLSGGTFTVTQGGAIDILVVGGGAGGNGGIGSNQSGGAGAGAVIYHTNYNIASGTYSVTIGAGGSAGPDDGFGGTGGDTTVGSLYTAKGGGRGGRDANGGYDGGSGGGGSRNNDRAAGSAVTTNVHPAGATVYGNDGAVGTQSTTNLAGGGGGAGSSPPSANTNYGGDGIRINIDGNNY